MLHSVVFTGSQAQQATFSQVSLLQTLFESIQNNGLQITAPLNNVIMAATQGAHLLRLQLRSPSLTQAGLLPDLVPVRQSVLDATHFANIVDLRANPLKLPNSESLQAWITQNNAGAEQEYVLLTLCDQVPAPVNKPFHTIRFTGTTTLSANALTQAFMTSEQALPAGKYDCIGARMQSTTGVFFRLGTGFNGTRPGGVCCTTDAADDPDIQRYGALGTWFSFQNTDQIVAEVLATAGDTAQTLEMDVVGPY